MRYQNARFAAPAVLLSLIAGVACRDDARDATATDALQRDLALAQSSAVALAPSARDLPATRFVSALEAGERPAAGAGRAARPTRHSATKAAAMHADHAAPAVAPVVAQAPAAAAATETAPAPAPEATTVAQASGRTSGESASDLPNDGEVTVARPSDGDGTVPTPERRRGRGLGGIFGGIGGAVIRGGTIGDDDHCERDHPRGMGGIGMPGRFPGSGGTFGVPSTGIGRGVGVRY